jgi:hypothetical protein
MVVRFDFDFVERRVVFEEKERGTLSLEMGVVSLEAQNSKLF